MTVTLEFLARELEAELHGPADVEVSGLGTIGAAGPHQLTFLANPRYRAFLENTSAGAVLLSADQREHCPVPALVVKDPYLAFAKASHFFDTAPAGARRDPSERGGGSFSDGAGVGIAGAECGGRR